MHLSSTVSLLATWSCLLAVVSGAPASSSSTPTAPSKDSWYKAPENFAKAAPGTALRVRRAPGNLTAIFNNSSDAYNILYRTTDTNYKPSWAVTTLFVPKTQQKSNSSTLLSYQIPYNSPDVDASPSYVLYNPVFNSGLVGSDIQTLLGYGWYVNVPDFEGPLASFALGVQEGHATLDSIRAALHINGGPEKNAKYAMWGYSGGSIASEWAAELQVQYAPELSFSGAALGGVVSNLTSAVSQVGNGTWWGGLLPLGLLGITTQFPDARAYLLSQLKTTGPYNESTFLLAQNQDTTEAFPFYAFQPISEYFINGLTALLQAPIIQKILNTNGVMGYYGVPQMPLYMYKAVQDEITPVVDTDVLVDRYCGVGANILYERNTIGGHAAEETNGDASALAWLKSVLEGNYTHTGCTVRDVALNVTDSLQ